MDLIMRDMTKDDVAIAAGFVCDSEIGQRYGFEPISMAATLESALAAAPGTGAELFVAEREGLVSGFAWAEPRGAFSSAPYLRLIAVDASQRGSGLGDALLAEFEGRTSAIGRPWFLLVSDFNLRAQAFYERRGYERVGALADFARQGIAEIIMIKSIQRSNQYTK